MDALFYGFVQQFFYVEQRHTLRVRHTALNCSSKHMVESRKQQINEQINELNIQKMNQFKRTHTHTHTHTHQKVILVVVMISNALNLLNFDANVCMYSKLHLQSCIRDLGDAGTIRRRGYKMLLTLALPSRLTARHLSSESVKKNRSVTLT